MTTFRAQIARATIFCPLQRPETGALLPLSMVCVQPSQEWPPEYSPHRDTYGIGSVFESPDFQVILAPEEVVLSHYRKDYVFPSANIAPAKIFQGACVAQGFCGPRSRKVLEEAVELLWGGCRRQKTWLSVHSELLRFDWESES